MMLEYEIVWNGDKTQDGDDLPRLLEGVITMTASEAGRALSALGASKGGLARAAKLSPERRAEIASLAGRQRAINAIPIWAARERVKLEYAYRNHPEALEFIASLSSASIDALRPRWMREVQVHNREESFPTLEARGRRRNRLGASQRIFIELATAIDVVDHKSSTRDEADAQGQGA